MKNLRILFAIISFIIFPLSLNSWGRPMNGADIGSGHYGEIGRITLNGEIDSVAWNINGTKFVALTDFGSNVEIINYMSMKKISQLQRNGGDQPRCVFFDGNDNIITPFGPDKKGDSSKYALSILDESGRKLLDVERPKVDGGFVSGDILACAISRDRKRMIISFGIDSHVFVYDVQTLRVIREINLRDRTAPKTVISAMKFIGDTHDVIINVNFGDICFLREDSDCSVIWQHKRVYDSGINMKYDKNVAVNENGTKFLLSGVSISNYENEKGRLIKLISRESGKCSDFKINMNSINAISFDNSGRYAVIIGNGNETLNIIDSLSGDLVYREKFSSPATHIELSSDNIAAISFGSQVKFIRMEN